MNADLPWTDEAAVATAAAWPPDTGVAEIAARPDNALMNLLHRRMPMLSSSTPPAGWRLLGSSRWRAANVLANVPAVAAAERAAVLEIDGAVGPAIAGYVVRE